MPLTPKQKDQLAPFLVIFAVLFVLSSIIILGQFFHQTLQDEMAGQFNRQQLLLAREVAMNIEGFLDRVYKDIYVISRLPEIHKIHESPRCREVADAITAQIQNEVLISVQVLDKKGRVIYDSTLPANEGIDLSGTSYFKQTRKLRKKEKLITDLLEIHESGNHSKKFIIAAPIYQHLRNPVIEEFNGVVLAVLSLDAITKKYLVPIKSGTRGYAWMLDSAGTLLYHPTQPMMVGKNLYQTDQTCFRCHKSFNTEKKMIEGKAETFGYYEAPGGENKLLAFYTIPLGDRSWFVAVSAPYSDIISLMQKSRQFYSLLIVSIFLTTIIASGITIFTYKKKIKAEEHARHLENQRRLEHEVLIAKNYLENIVENTKTNLMVLDNNLTVKTLNSAQALTIGRPKEDIVNRPFFSLFPDNLKPYDGTPIEAILQKTLMGQSFEIKDYEITGIQKDPIYLDMNITPLLIEGAINGILITANDVTTRVHLEEALKQYTVELEHKVDVETATAKKLEQQVLHSEKLAALGRLAAGIAHEIGNPLTSISTFAQMLREMASDEFTKNSLDIINNHIQRITDIVRQMSTFSRPAEPNIKYIQVNDIVQASLDLMRLDKRMKNTIEITTRLDPELPKTMIDEGQISQVFINIILNSLDAMPDGGRLEVTTGRGADDQGREAIYIAFSDSGTGIEADDIPKIFDPFFTTKEVGKGTGLGLAISYNIIKRFKGDIKVESRLGKGTTFTVILPMEKE